VQAVRHVHVCPSAQENQAAQLLLQLPLLPPALVHAGTKALTVGAGTRTLLLLVAAVFVAAAAAAVEVQQALPLQQVP
jgi:hypothetical protein